MRLRKIGGFVSLTLLAACLSIGFAAAQQAESTLTPRQLFYTERTRPAKAPAAKPPATKPPAVRPKPAAAPAPAAGGEKQREPVEAAGAPETEQRQAPYLGLRYSIVQVGSDGRTHEVNPDTEFRNGDAIRLRVKPNDGGYLYIVNQGTSGKWDVLFPTAGFREGSNAVARMEEVTVPGGDGAFAFYEQPGSERLFIILSEKPESDLDGLIYSLRSGGDNKHRTLMASASIPQSQIDKLRTGLVSRDLRVERRPSVQSGKREEAVYVVNAAASKDNGRVVAEVTLKHR